LARELFFLRQEIESPDRKTATNHQPEGFAGVAQKWRFPARASLATKEIACD
jgi:hypothetical protein